MKLPDRDVTMCRVLRAIREYGARVERWLAGEIEETWERNLCQCHFVHHKADVMSHAVELKALGEKLEPKCLSYDMVYQIQQLQP